MPTSMLIGERELRNQGVDYEDDEIIHSLATRYRVSMQAMTFRLANLSEILAVNSKAAVGRSKTEALKKRRELLNQLDKDGHEPFVGDQTRFAFLARKFREEKLIPAVYVGERKIAGRRELSAPRSWLLQLEYYFGEMKLPSITLGEIKKFAIWLSKIPARSTIAEDENGKLVLNIKENGGQRGIESINRAVELLRTVLNYAVEEKMLREGNTPYDSGLRI